MVGQSLKHEISSRMFILLLVFFAIFFLGLKKTVLNIDGKHAIDLSDQINVQGPTSKSLDTITGYAMADGSRVERSFSSVSITTGDTITVTLSVILNGAYSYYAIEESLPTGWVVPSKWVTSNYCTLCGVVPGKEQGDVDCSIPCAVGEFVCDTNANQFCFNGTGWTSSNYCNNCAEYDSDCAGTCQNDSCDTTAKEWCNAGVWQSANYATRCGRYDADYCPTPPCSNTCVNQQCDLVNDKICFAEISNKGSNEDESVIKLVKYTKTGNLPSTSYTYNITAPGSTGTGVFDGTYQIESMPNPTPTEGLTDVYVGTGTVCTDVDGDNYYLETSGCSGEPGFLGHNDCNDGNQYIYPGAPERCDGVDNQCPGDAGYLQTDEGVDNPGCQVYFMDGDNDGYGLINQYQCLCSQQGNYKILNVDDTNDDCNDGVFAIHPGATEQCSSTDYNCDGDPYDSYNEENCGILCVNGGGNWSSLGFGNGDNCCGASQTAFGEDNPFWTPDICDANDNDCDGLYDENSSNMNNNTLSQTCWTGNPGNRNKGICKDGYRVCTWGTWGSCIGQVLPAPAEICINGLDDDCNGLVDDTCACDAGDTQSCGTSNVGECQLGTQTCMANGQWNSTCVGKVDPVSETCNGLDDDCDGLVDDNAGVTPWTSSCYTGSPLTRGVGQCSDGVKTCQGSSGWSSCVGQVLPQPETCNGLDDNCNGAPDIPDEGCTCITGATTSCGTSSVGECRLGIKTCLANGSWGSTCVGKVDPVSETCNGLDDDCDGLVDDNAGVTPWTRSCYTGIPNTTMNVGECRPGTETCQGSTGWGSCMNEIIPQPEQCDAGAKDENCDGQSNEICACTPGSTTQCGSTDEGECSFGTLTCLANGSWGSTCVGKVDPVSETCNGLDDDCDGLVDDNAGVTPWTRSCYTGIPNTTMNVGECRGGSQMCSSGSWGSCIGQIIPQTEICDGLDTDCEGDSDVPDEGCACLPGEKQPCGTSNVGQCKLGNKTCMANGQWNSTCVGKVDPVSETCNGKDDDCDGLTDDNAGIIPWEESCYNGPNGTENVGLCVVGTISCVSGGWSSCNGEIQPVTEICDGYDNDCDGEKDEDCPCTTPGLNQTCGSNIGQCTYGAQTCLSNYTWGPCIGGNKAKNETCNNLDDDCDGTTDEGTTSQPLTQIFYTGSPVTRNVGLCSEGTRECQNGTYVVIINETLPGIEMCDNLSDEDCDGEVDEVCACTPNATTTCGGYNLGECQYGTKVCLSNGTWDTSCVGSIGPTTETCDDKKDNDCDGQADEGCKDDSKNTCFLPGTKILMSDGTFKPIENILVGESVLSFDEETSSIRPGSVSKTYVHYDTPRFLIINGELKLTPSHPLYAGGVWKEASSIDIGDTLTSVALSTQYVEKIEHHEEKATVYNLEVLPYRTYFAESFLVHNKGSSPGPSGPPPSCKELWTCSAWSSCNSEGFKNRSCTDSKECGTTVTKPIVVESCAYGGTCSDRLMNGDEHGIDCGGRCGISCEAVSAGLTSSTLQITASPIQADIFDAYELNVTIKNNGQKSVENIRVALSKWSNELKTIENILPRDSESVNIDLLLPSVPGQNSADIQIFYKNALIQKKTITAMLSVPDITTKAYKELSGNKVYSVVVIDNTNDARRQIESSYEITKNDDTYYESEPKTHTLSEGEVYYRIDNVNLHNLLPKGTYQVRSSFYEKGDLITSKTTYMKISNNQKGLNMRMLFYILLLIITGGAGYVFYASYMDYPLFKKR